MSTTGENNEREAARRAAIVVLRDWGNNSYCDQRKKTKMLSVANSLEREQHLTESIRQSNNPLHDTW